MFRSFGDGSFANRGPDIGPKRACGMFGAKLNKKLGGRPVLLHGFRLGRTQTRDFRAA